MLIEMVRLEGRIYEWWGCSVLALGYGYASFLLYEYALWHMYTCLCFVSEFGYEVITGLASVCYFYMSFDFTYHAFV